MSRMRKIRQITDNSHLNFFEMEVEDRKGHTFPYYMASRAVDTSDLKMNGAGLPDRPDGVVMYGLYGEKKDRVVLVRQYRHPLGGYIYEFPAGLVEEGEDLHQAAAREMREETGLELSIENVKSMYEKPFYTTIGMTDECCSMVFGYASGTVSRAGLEDSEELEVVLADRREVARILKEERVALMCAYMLMFFLADEKDPFSFLRAADPDQICEKR